MASRPPAFTAGQSPRNREYRFPGEHPRIQRRRIPLIVQSGRDNPVLIADHHQSHEILDLIELMPFGVSSIRPK